MPGSCSYAGGNPSQNLCCEFRGIIEDAEIHRKFHTHFNSEIIVYRNALAHEKSDNDKLFIQAKKEFIVIDDKFFSNIKRSIKKFTEIFNFLEDVH